jgi:hypothetical protein
LGFGVCAPGRPRWFFWVTLAEPLSGLWTLPAFFLAFPVVPCLCLALLGACLSCLVVLPSPCRLLPFWSCLAACLSLGWLPLSGLRARLRGAPGRVSVHAGWLGLSAQGRPAWGVAGGPWGLLGWSGVGLLWFACWSWWGVLAPSLSLVACCSPAPSVPLVSFVSDFCPALSLLSLGVLAVPLSVLLSPGLCVPLLSLCPFVPWLLLCPFLSLLSLCPFPVSVGASLFPSAWVASPRAFRLRSPCQGFWVPLCKSENKGEQGGLGGQGQRQAHPHKQVQARRG